MKKVLLSTIFSLLSMLLPAQITQVVDYMTDIIHCPVNPLNAPAIQIPDSIMVPGSEPFAEMQQENRFLRNAIYMEVGGPGLLYSINYEYRIKPHLSLRAGFTSWTLRTDLFLVQFERFKYTAFPLLVNYLTGNRQSSHLEIGIGLMPAFTSGRVGLLGMPSNDVGSRSLLLGTASLGYRYQAYDGGFVFRATLTPLVSKYGSSFFAGISFGIGF
jgi:hypothetical protein